ncbi:MULTISPECIES: cell division topological specificity factor MinE [unclassified Candidatus Frackibacter]|uniref:cell division topological specificity factor MinE n=1 Tax=unclassified Candidatus Frackibacter TaxID=2648818 RepID=UPI0008923E2A|nr:MULTISPECIES: cell division topological specificity factor MinE [unclassified Candidatus Frackibacter]SDC40520.1 cell division topological specificity factor MinE [Candidatus Frackibacter sp. WG11]SEM60279.1 cell division topological specificity factor MinE [Candidatus Frackibacter sp. WG12]SFL61707.1 cell division topological specificity factor MinE [Candidatus Frackibacter sp. WG13]
MLDKIKSFFSDEANSKDLAKERLKLVLIHDRISISPELLDNMKEELLTVVSKYVEVERHELDIDFQEQDDDALALVANIPVKELKRRARK